MTKNSLGLSNWFILILASSAIILTTFLLRGILSTPAPQKEEVSNECGVCGPQGIHNIEGKTCPEGLVCKRGLTTSLSYCVKSHESVTVCEEATKGDLDREQNGSTPSIPSDWKKIDASGKFSFYIPPYLKKDDTSGADSYTEGYSNENFKLSFDYSPFADTLDDYSQVKGYQEKYLVVSGRQAKIVFFENTYGNNYYYGFPYVASMSFGIIDEYTENRLTFGALFKNESDLEIAEKIFRSISFPE